MVDSIPPDEGYEMLDGEMHDVERDKNGYANAADSDGTQILVNGGAIITYYRE